MSTILARIPVVGGLAYREATGALPETFEAALSVEPDNRYFPHAIAVSVNGAKVGYVAPEIAPAWFEAVKEAASPLSVSGRRASSEDHETSGVEILLDFSPLSAR